MYNVVVASGCQCAEILYLIENARKLRAVKLPYGRCGRLPYEDIVSKKFLKPGFAVKYFRKWWRQTLKRLGIDSEDIEAFQGRPTSWEASTTLTGYLYWTGTTGRSSHT